MIATTEPDVTTEPCDPCGDGEHADDGTGQVCPCCGIYVDAVTS